MNQKGSKDGRKAHFRCNDPLLDIYGQGQLSAFAAFYKQTHGVEFTAESLMDAWREFQNICGPIDINAAYLSVRVIRARIVLLSRCQVCHATFIYDMGSRHTERCPFCRTRVLAS